MYHVVHVHIQRIVESLNLIKNIIIKKSEVQEEQICVVATRTTLYLLLLPDPCFPGCKS